MSLRKLVSLGSLVLVCMALTCMGQGTGTIRYEVWEGIGGTAVTDLTGNANFPDNPSWDDELALFESPTNMADNFGGRVYGWLHPTETADYTFWLAADDGAEVWLSTDDDPANAVLIVAEDSWGGSRDWFDRGQKSDPVSLVGGEKYYIEGLYKEGGGGDNIAVAWQINADTDPNATIDPNDVVVIDGAYLSPAPRQPSLLLARNVGPADGAVDVPVEALLEWTPGPTALMNKVFLSTDAVIDEADLIAETPEASVDPELEAGVTYYWRVDGVDMDGDHIGNVWSFTVIPLEAHFPSPAAGAVWQPADSVLSWTPGLGALVHNVFFSTDMALVEAKDPSVQVGQWLSDASYDPGPLEAATTYYWAVDEFLGATTNPGPVWSFTTLDPDIAMNVESWNDVAAAASPAYQATHVADGVYDIGELSGDITYEFIVISDPCETEASMALIGRRSYGDTAAGIKYEQWNNTGTYGATLFGVVDLDFGVPTAPGEYTHLAFVSQDDPNAPTTTLYVNGEEAGVVDRAITLNGIVGIGYAASAEDGSASFDNFDGSIFGVAIYDEALSAETIAKNAAGFLSPIPIADPDLMVYYTFDEEGPKVIDQSGHANNGTIMGDPQWVTGIAGGAMEFDGDGDFVDSGYTEDLATYTIACWAMSPVAPNADGTSGPLHREKNYQFNWNHGDETYQGAAAMNVGDWPAAKYGPVEADTWYFLTATFDGTSFKAYRDGVLITAVDVAGPPVAETGSMKIARHATASGAANFFVGTVDEARVYSRALSEAEIVAIMLGLSDVTGPDDVVQGVPNDGDWPGAETPDLAVDDDTATKYLHFKGSDGPSGIQIAPAVGSTVVTGLSFTSANDAIERDPITFELSGSNESIDGPYELIASGDIVDFNQVDAIARFTKTSTPILFENTAPYVYYQVIFPSVRDAAAANSMQIAEVELLGVTLPLPVAHYTLDDGEGVVALDSSGNGNDGALNGDPQWVDGVLGGALELDGNGDFVDCGNDAVFDIQVDITVAAWINVAQFDKDWQAIVNKGDSAWRLHRSGGSSNIAWGTSGVTASAPDLTSTATVDDGEWHHLAGTYDGAQKCLYIDGALDAVGDATGNIGISTHTVNIGENNQATGRFFTGLVDDVRIYNQALTGAEVGIISKP